MDIKQILQGIKGWIESNYYYKDAVDQLLESISSVNCYEVYAQLPNEGQGNIIYLIGPSGNGADKYEEYIYSNSEFIKIGDTSVDLSGYVTSGDLETAIGNIDLNGYLQSSDIAAWAKAENKPSYSYSEISNTPTIPTNVSDLNNDAGYLTTHQDISGKQDVISDLETIRGGAALGATSIQSHQDISGKEDITNKVTSISSSSTDAQYPSAKCVFGAIKEVKDTVDVLWDLNTETVLISLSSDQTAPDTGLNGAVITITNETTDSAIFTANWAGQAISTSVIKDTSYSVSVSDVSGYTIATKSYGSYTAQEGNTRSVSFSFVKVPVDTIIIDQSKSDPATMVSGDINGPAIQAIRANSHRYLGKYTAAGTQTICQLKDDDSTKYSDGSAATLTGEEGDVWMRLPKFYYKVSNGDTDQISISFAYGAKPDNTYKEWDNNKLIAVYHAYNDSSKLYSKSGVTPTASVSQADFKTYARARGTGFHIVSWDWHNVMIALYLGMYGNMNSQETCGYGKSGYGWAVGGTNSLGMTDTNKTTGANDMNFWGIENWWANLLEWVDNVVIDAGTLKVYDPLTGDMLRSMTATTASSVYSKRIVSEDLDIYAGPSHTGGSNTQGWCDYYYGSSGDSRVVRRGGSNADANCGVACVFAIGVSSGSIADGGSRLAFSGEIVEASSVEAYKELTVSE